MREDGEVGVLFSTEKKIRGVNSSSLAKYVSPLRVKVNKPFLVTTVVRRTINGYVGPNVTEISLRHQETIFSGKDH